MTYVVTKDCLEVCGVEWYTIRRSNVPSQPSNLGTSEIALGYSRSHVVMGINRVSVSEWTVTPSVNSRHVNDSPDSTYSVDLDIDIDIEAGDS